MKIASAPKAVTRDDPASSGAVILPFRLSVTRAKSDIKNSKAPPVQLAALAPAKSRAKKPKQEVTASERPSLALPRYRGWFKQAVIGAILVHLAVFAFLQMQFVQDVERAANKGGQMSSDGTVVLDVEVVAEAKLPPAKTPTNMTAPDAKTQTNTPPQVKQQEKEKAEEKSQPLPAPNQAPQFALPQEEIAPPQKAETAPAPQSPNQEKRDEELKAEQQRIAKQKALENKKKQEQAAPSTAASPNRAAAVRNNQGNAGAQGVVQNGGQANASAYSAIVLAHLQRFRVYPDQARSAGVTGVSTVRFTIGASGNVMGVSLAGSSGAGVLDQAALAMVHRAAPFPPIPASLGRGSMSFAAPIRFNLR